MVELQSNLATLSWNIVGLETGSGDIVIRSSILGEVVGSSVGESKVKYDVYFGVATKSKQ